MESNFLIYKKFFCVISQPGTIYIFTIDISKQNTLVELVEMPDYDEINKWFWSDYNMTQWIFSDVSSE